MGGVYNIEIEQGSSFELEITYKDTNDAVIDLSSAYTAAMQIRESYSSTTTLLSLTNGSGITLTNTSPNIKITVGPATTAALDFDHAVYDLELVNGAETIKVIRGSAKLIREVTK